MFDLHLLLVGGIFRRFFERGSSLDFQVSGNPKETFSISTQPEKTAAEVSLQALVPLPPMSPPHSPSPLPFSTILFGDCSARMRAIARTRDLLHPELYFIENGCSSGEHHMCMCSSSYYCYYLLVRYVCSEDDITSCHITCTCTCTCSIPLAFLAPPTPCTPAHAHHSLIRALAHEHLPQVQCRAREVGSVDEGFQVSLLLRIDHMKSHTSLFHNSSCPSMAYYPASLVVCELLSHRNLSQAHRVVHQVGSHTTHHHHHITSSLLYTSPLYSLYFFSVICDYGLYVPGCAVNNCTTL